MYMWEISRMSIKCLLDVISGGTSNNVTRMDWLRMHNSLIHYKNKRAICMNYLAKKNGFTKDVKFLHSLQE